LLEKADEWRPALIIVGSHGRTGLAKVLLGSVSQKVLHEAACSVRIARGRARPPATPVSIIIGVDGSPGATAAVQAVAARHWPPGSEVRLVCAELRELPTAGNQVTGPIAQWLREERARMRHAVQDAEALFREIGLTVTTVSKEGDPKELLCAEAENWGADCIFVGAKKLARVDRFLLGSVSSAVAARAPCSVEVVRQQE
jgi:nucleotide-binding universal stress UspA family protein